MASIQTGEMFTEEEFKKITPERKEELKIIKLTPQEENMLSKMNRKGRRTWLKQNKK